MLLSVCLFCLFDTPLGNTRVKSRCAFKNTGAGGQYNRYNSDTQILNDFDVPKIWRWGKYNSAAEILNDFVPQHTGAVG